MHVTRLCKFGVSQGSGMIGGATTLDVTLMYVVVRRTPCRQEPAPLGKAGCSLRVYTGTPRGQIKTTDFL